MEDNSGSDNSVEQGNTNETSNTNGVPGSMPGETKQETVNRLYKVTVDGAEMEVDENELRRGYAHNKAASKRMEEAAFSRKETEQVIQLFKTNPKEAFRLLGSDARAFAEQVINEQLQDAMLTPQERELNHYRNQANEYQKQQQFAEQQRQAQIEQEQIEEFSTNFVNDITDVLASADVPKTTYTVGRMAYYLEAALNAGYSATAKDVIDHVKEEYKQDRNAYVKSLNEEQLSQFLGPDIIKMINKASVKAGPPKGKIDPIVNKNVRAKPADKKVSTQDWFKQNRVD